MATPPCAPARKGARRYAGAAVRYPPADGRRRAPAAGHPTLLAASAQGTVDRGNDRPAGDRVRRGGGGGAQAAGALRHAAAPFPGHPRRRTVDRRRPAAPAKPEILAAIPLTHGGRAAQAIDHLARRGNLTEIRVARERYLAMARAYVHRLAIVTWIGYASRSWLS
jgi:hypothetical protein